MIEIVGINHKSAPINIREQFAIDKDEIHPFLKILKERTGIANAVVLSTCNRMEIYFTIPKDCKAGLFKIIINELLIQKKLTIDSSLASHFYNYTNIDAVKHLFNVASGINSMVLGEKQVLSQIKEAYRISVANKFTDAILNRVFHKAFETGKRVRTETSINKGSSSVSYAAVELIFRLFKDAPGHSSILLIGAGETGELVIQSLVKKGYKHIYVSNRTFSKAKKIAGKYDARAVTFDSFTEYLNKCDIIITSTSSKELIIKHSLMQEMIKKRNNKPIFIIDISVPRDVEKNVKDIENVHLYTIDDLEEIVKSNYEKRQGEIEKANIIIDEIVAEFSTWVQTLNLSPAIELITGKYESIMSKELSIIKNKMTENEYKRVSEFAHFIKGKYLGHIIKNLKFVSENGRKLEYIDLVNNLFGLRENKS